MMDLNFDQGSLTQWWTIRGRPDSPKLVDEVENITRDVKKLASGYDWLFIDTPPFDMDVIEQAIAVADAVIIPVRSGLFDLLASEAVVEMCLERKKPFSLLLNAIEPRFKTLTKEARVAFVDIGPLFATQIDQRLPHIRAISKGKTGAEIDKSAKAEIDGLWVEVKRLIEGRAS
jgi:chromosome partitioning protein